MVDEDVDWEEYQRKQEENENKDRRWGFRSKTTDMAEGKADIKAPKKIKGKKPFYEKKLKKPGIARYLPKPISVSPTIANIMGIPSNLKEIFKPLDETPKIERKVNFLGFDIKPNADAKKKPFRLI